VKESPRILIASAVVHVATWREVFAAVWHTTGTAGDVRGVNAAQVAFGQRLGSGERMITISVVSARAAMTLDADVRHAVEEGTRANKERMKASAVVIATTGFGASAIRSLITTILLVNRTGYPTRVFDGEDAACTWVAPLLTRSPASPASEADLREALRAIPSSQ
jgi:hypothetical protein